MIKVNSKIVNAGFKLYGEALDKGILEKQVNGDFKSALPFKFKYNGSWLIKHKCSKCNEECNFGLHFDISISPYSNLSFQQTEYLCSKYYDISFLNFVSNLFVKTRIISNEKGDFIIFENFYEEDFPITSSIQPIFYSCKECQSEFLCLLRIGFPYSPDKGCHQGLIGIIFIDDIIQIEIDGGEKFIDLLEKYRKKSV